MSDLKLVVGEDGALEVPALAEVKKKLSENLKSGILAALPEEFFDAQVDQAFKAMTEPRKAGAQGDKRCEACRSSYGINAKPVCPHVMVDVPSEIQEMILSQMRKRADELVKAWCEKWTADGLEDSVMVVAWEEVAKVAAESFMRTMGNEIATRAIHALKVAEGQTCNSCGSHVVPQSNCATCGSWAS